MAHLSNNPNIDKCNIYQELVLLIILHCVSFEHADWFKKMSSQSKCSKRGKRKFTQKIILISLCTELSISFTIALHKVQSVKVLRKQVTMLIFTHDHFLKLCWVTPIIPTLAVHTKAKQGAREYDSSQSIMLFPYIATVH